MLSPNQTSSWKPTALVIDKDADTHRSIHVMLGKDYDVHHAYFPRLALSLLEKRRFNVVFTSLDMGSTAEMPELHRTIAAISKDKGIPVIALADALSPSASMAGCLNKPLEGKQFLAALQAALTPAQNTAPEEATVPDA